MKIAIKEIRQTIRSLLKEAVCPECGNKQAYIGMNSVECPQKGCSHFSQRQADDVGITSGKGFGVLVGDPTKDHATCHELLKKLLKSANLTAGNFDPDSDGMATDHLQITNKSNHSSRDEFWLSVTSDYGEAAFQIGSLGMGSPIQINGVELASADQGTIVVFETPAEAIEKLKAYFS
jgi:hypothetical protein